MSTFKVVDYQAQKVHGLTFSQWKRRVDNYIEAKLGGLTSDDLPDLNYYDMWAEGKSARSAASRAMRGAREY